MSASELIEVSPVRVPAYLVRAVHVDRMMVFLIAQRFDRCGIEGFDVAFLGDINGKIRHYGFAGTGWGRDQYVAAGFERVIGFGLEVVQFEGQGFGAIAPLRTPDGAGLFGMMRTAAKGSASGNRHCPYGVGDVPLLLSVSC